MRPTPLADVQGPLTPDPTLFSSVQQAQNAARMEASRHHPRSGPTRGRRPSATSSLQPIPGPGPTGAVAGSTSMRVIVEFHPYWPESLDDPHTPLAFTVLKAHIRERLSLFGCVFSWDVTSTTPTIDIQNWVRQNLEAAPNHFQFHNLDALLDSSDDAANKLPFRLLHYPRAPHSTSPNHLRFQAFNAFGSRAWETLGDLKKIPRLIYQKEHVFSTYNGNPEGAITLRLGALLSYYHFSSLTYTIGRIAPKVPFTSAIPGFRSHSHTCLTEWVYFGLLEDTFWQSGLEAPVRHLRLEDLQQYGPELTCNDLEHGEFRDDEPEDNLWRSPSPFPSQSESDVTPPLPLVDTPPLPPAPDPDTATHGNLVPSPVTFGFDNDFMAPPPPSPDVQFRNTLSVFPATALFSSPANSINIREDLPIALTFPGWQRQVESDSDPNRQANALNITGSSMEALARKVKRAIYEAVNNNNCASLLNTHYTFRLQLPSRPFPPTQPLWTPNIFDTAIEDDLDPDQPFSAFAPKGKEAANVILQPANVILQQTPRRSTLDLEEIEYSHGWDLKFDAELLRALELDAQIESPTVPTHDLGNRNRRTQQDK
ncbi:hypothetical protein FRB99_002668 [Tulasnella sp. 403]|nr:hypothetical protein FRB99_002668 [Tulasnella sp. 403]